MSKKKPEDYKRGSNPDGSTSPNDIAKIVAQARRNAAKGRHPKKGGK